MKLRSIFLIVCLFSSQALRADYVCEGTGEYDLKGEKIISFDDLYLKEDLLNNSERSIQIFLGVTNSNPGLRVQIIEKNSDSLQSIYGSMKLLKYEKTEENQVSSIICKSTRNKDGTSAYGERRTH